MLVVIWLKLRQRRNESVPLKTRVNNQITSTFSDKTKFKEHRLRSFGIKLNNMAKFNIYKIEKTKENDLLAKLQKSGLSLVSEKQIGGFGLSFYLSTEPEAIDIWWTKLYADYLGDIEEPKNKAHYAVFILSSESLLYAVSMKKSHFYLKDFCDIDFGINLAERIADSNHLKLKNAKLFGGKKNKTIISYQENSQFDFDSGESIHYVKAKTVDASRWGKVTSFGNSAQFNLEMKPDELPAFIQSIEIELKKEPKTHLPRATTILDAKKIYELDEKLIEEIFNLTNTTLQTSETTISGVDFVFLDATQYWFVFERKSYQINGDRTYALTAT